VFSYRVITGAMIVAGSVFASSLCAGTALAQYEPVGKPLQLLPPAHQNPKSSVATPRSRVAARKAAKSEARSEARSEAKFETRAEAKSASRSDAKGEPRQHVSLRRKHRPRTEMAEQKRPQRPAVVAAAETPGVQMPAAPAATAAAAPPPQPPPPAPPTTGELVVGGQTVQVRSPDEANELDLAADTPSAPATLPAPASDTAAPAPDSAPLYNLAAANAAAAPAAPAASDPGQTTTAAPADPATAAAAIDAPKADLVAPKTSVGSASWIMQIMAALGGAVAAGSAAWFLIGSASPRIKLSEWDEANSEEV
jgi:hypothetical protein